MRQLLDITQFAEALGVTPSCIRRWILERRINVVKLGRLVRIPVGEVDRLINAGLHSALQDSEEGKPRSIDKTSSMETDDR